VDVAEKDERRVAKPLGEHRIEVLEDVELGVEGVRLVQLVGVLALPAEGPARLAHEAREIDAARTKHREVLLVEVLTDDRDGLHRDEHRRADAEEGGRTTQHLIALTERSLNGVERDRTDDEHRRHDRTSPGGPAERAGGRTLPMDDLALAA